MVLWLPRGVERERRRERGLTEIRVVERMCSGRSRLTDKEKSEFGSFILYIKKS